MTSGEIILAVVAALLAMLSAAVSGIETALASLTEDARLRLTTRSRRIARSMARAFERPEVLDQGLILTNILANFPLIVICLVLVDQIPGINIREMVSALVVFAIVILVCEIVPKMVALAFPIQVASIGLPLAVSVTRVLHPIARAYTEGCDRVADLFAPRRGAGGVELTEEEIDTLISLGREQGTLLSGEAEIISELRKLSGEAAKHCMTPRVDLFTLPDDLSNHEVLRELRSKRYRRVPVIGETPDDILGILELDGFLVKPETPYLEQLAPPSYVPETMSALDLLRSFLLHKQQMAILVDEFGGVEGVLTLTDFLDELLPDMPGSAADQLYIEMITEDRIVASGDAKLDDLSEYLGNELEEEGVETIGGLVLNRVNVLPRQGTRIRLGDWNVTVRRATRKRVREVVIARREEGEDEA